MLFYETVEPATLELLRNLMKYPLLTDFCLVGGTALALQFGHRKSIDIDLFTTKEFEAEQYLEKLKSDFKILPVTVSKNSLTLEIDKIKVDIIRHNYPVISTNEIIDEIRFASLKDITSMKLNAIVVRGSKKDFYDLFELFQKFSLKEMLIYFEMKYENSLQLMVLKSLTYFDDADEEPDLQLLKNTDWEIVKSRIRKEVKQFS